MLTVSLLDIERVQALLDSDAFRVEEGVDFVPAPVFAKGADGWRPTGDQLTTKDGLPLWSLSVRVSVPAFGGGLRWIDGALQVPAAECPEISDLAKEG
ncbi:hypothetical protein [Trueperella sp. LYQ141]|uniref:hypothetical protein n=1 Tax=Trueperella sp. LYQ141 TaxID=3391058 RepID=UPI003982E35F